LCGLLTQRMYYITNSIRLQVLSRKKCPLSLLFEPLFKAVNLFFVEIG